jgi:prefoldin subunit 5
MKTSNQPSSNRRAIERLERKVDDLTKAIVALQKAIREFTPLS